MKTEKEIREALRKCAEAMRGKESFQRCWMGGTCCSYECSTVGALAWVVGKKVDHCEEDLLEK